ncbi:MAG: hypothetical protein IJR72_05435 [Oscillospiraceae bacterium]|nr:hypothetical protein [Oscillospiraceae bacterium]
MNQFEHERTQIIKSTLDFSRVSGKFSFSQDATLSGGMAISKDLEHSPSVRSTASFEFGNETENDAIFIYVEIVSVFKISHLDKETLQKDAEAFCRPYTIRELAKKVTDLTKLHTGNPLNFPISDLTD